MSVHDSAFPYLAHAGFVIPDMVTLRCLPLLEVIVTGVDEALAAVAGGADRVELVAERARGGLTPALKTVEAVLAAVAIPVHVIARPHDRGFIYRGADEAALVRDVNVIATLGPAAIVTGAINERGGIDAPLLREILDATDGIPITFHRAFDKLADLGAAYDVLAELPQVTRVLTSGGAPNAWAGRAAIAALIAKGKGPVVLAGTGIDVRNARALLEATGAKEIHVGTGACSNGIVSADKVAAIKEAL